MPRRRSQPRRAPAKQEGDATSPPTGHESIDIENAPDRRSVSPELAKKYTNRSVERVISMLNLLQRSVDGMSLAQVSNSIDMAKPTAFRYLWTLEDAEYVERDRDGQYRLGLGFVGMHSRGLQILQERARPWLERLRDQTGETANLGVLKGNSIVYVEIVPSKRAVRVEYSPGSQDPLHSTALGKAIASRLPEARVREILEQTDMEERSANTITTVQDYLDELDKVRRRGYGIDDCENDVDGRCVAVPIIGAHIPTAISVSGPASRFPIKDMEQIAASLTEVAGHLAKEPE
ncbi:IclR family transcriptional regulator [Phytoactinopolyspora endophytica]|uniref:IclR family transcriptional regulator n=1 Tax=Phytoactinopolyspora endophytica TaxID=1642495 RepID=UPI00101CBB06|nr:IclR family transcriptional regulator [Phytoactinopolyspora endophytica]